MKLPRGCVYYVRKAVDPAGTCAGLIVKENGMLTGRKALVLAVIVLAPMLGGCAESMLVSSVAAAGGAYMLTEQQQTDAMTDIGNLGGDAYVEDAVRVWLERGELPLPVLPDGSHSFRAKKGDAAKVQHARGARVVRLYDGKQLVATYVVAWDRRPLEYRVHEATNMLYAGELDVKTTPVIRITELYRE